MGSTATLEFQIRREGAAIDKELKSANLLTSADVLDPLGDGSLRPTILTSAQSADDFTNGDPKRHLIAARRCYASIASWLRSLGNSNRRRQPTAQSTYAYRALSLMCRPAARSPCTMKRIAANALEERLRLGAVASVVNNGTRAFRG